MDLAAVDRVDNMAGDVHAMYAHPAAGNDRGRRQADIAKADYGNLGKRLPAHEVPFACVQRQALAQIG
jgi:hypothetical protein